jgi:hypothetical protein
MTFRLWHVPVRLATGAFILNSGLSKLRITDEETHKQLHGMASNAYPALEGIEPQNFTKALALGEVALGTALLTPVIGSGLAGAGLSAFSTGLLGLYWRIPGLRQPGSIRPSQEGMAIAKDSWMLGIGLGLLIDAVTGRRSKPKRKPKHS